MLPEAFRFWELTRMSIAAWGVAGSIGYVLYLRPRLYPPPPEHRKAKAFTPREVEEWNAGKGVKPVQ